MDLRYAAINILMPPERDEKWDITRVSTGIECTPINALLNSRRYPNKPLFTGSFFQHLPAVAMPSSITQLNTANVFPVRAYVQL